MSRGLNTGMTTKTINDQQEAFCRAYALLGLTGAEAARQARYAHTSAKQQAFMLLKRPEIRARIEELAAERGVTFDAALTQIDIDASTSTSSASEQASDPAAKSAAKTAAKPAAGQRPAGPAPDIRSVEWILAEHQRNLLISKARSDTKEVRATLVEIGKLSGHYVDRSEVTHKQDPLAALTGPELLALKHWIASRRQAAIEPPIIDATATDVTPIERAAS